VRRAQQGGDARKAKLSDAQRSAIAALGGQARAKALSERRRQEIGRKGAKAWAKAAARRRRTLGIVEDVLKSRVFKKCGWCSWVTVRGQRSGGNALSRLLAHVQAVHAGRARAVEARLRRS